MARNYIAQALTIQRNKKTALFAIVLAALLVSGAFALLPSLVPSANAAVNVKTYAFLLMDPSPVGVGQNVYIDMWIDLPPPTANGIYGDRWQNFTLTETAPDGTVSTLGPYTSDAIGGANAMITPTEAGNYTFVFHFPGQVLAGNNMGPSTAGEAYIGNYYEPSTSAPATLVVVPQQLQLTAPENPLPSGYWQNPVEAYNHNWNVIDGNWLGIGAGFSKSSGMYSVVRDYNPYTTAPSTGHILWTLPEAFGGQMGGEFGNSEQSNYYAGFAYEYKFAPIVMNGILYYTEYPGSSTSPEGWNAINLRTGALIWHKNTTAVLMCGQTYNYKSMNQYGGLAYLWDTHGGMYDAMTGNWILTVSGMMGFGFEKVEAADGSILGYYTTTNATGEYLNMWNSSQCILASTPGYYPNATPIVTPEWRPPQGATIPFNLGIMWTVPIPSTYQGNAIPSIGFNFHGPGLDYDDNVLVLTSNSYPFVTNQNWDMEAGFSMTTGQMLWMTNRTFAPDSSVMITTGDGYLVEFTKQTLTFSAYNDTTGQLAWGPSVPVQNSLAYYCQNAEFIANGNLYTWTFGGYIYDFNVTTGQMIWSWNTGSAGENTPYGLYPLWTQYSEDGLLGGGVLLVQGGHAYGPPMYTGCQLYALNATTGKLIWSTASFDPGNGWALVDGYLVTLNNYDNQIYCYGKGLSATTVSVPQDVQTLGSSVLIQGTVTDQSPGQTALGIPEAGTPAIADQYQTAWSEYLFEQMPCPANATGVPVTLSVIDPNNNTYVIGQTTSDANGMYKFMWTPPVPGAYTVIATFAGSGAYYSSTAETALGVAQASSASAAPVTTPSPTSSSSSSSSSSPSPTTTSTPTSSSTASPSPSPAPAPSQGPPTETYIIAAVAVIIIIAIIAVVVVALRKRHA